MTELQAVIFDLDGTLLDNNAYHLNAWKRYLQEAGMEISEEDFRKNISGRTNYDAVRHIYKKDMSGAEAAEYYLRKEEVYREMYRDDIIEIAGLTEFLQELRRNNIAMAIATSDIQVNIDFMFEYVAIQQYFAEVINSSHITNGKPDPEIFLKTAERLGVSAGSCIVFEDSIAGIKAGKAAGMKVIALTTSHSVEELKIADLVINDYTEISYAGLLNVL